jgi:hypothetical protein
MEASLAARFVCQVYTSYQESSGFTLSPFISPQPPGASIDELRLHSQM